MKKIITTKELCHLAKTATALILVFATLLGVVVGFNAYVRFTVKETLLTDEYLRLVGDRLRPYLLFDVKGTVLLDRGALRLLEAPPKVKVIDAHGWDFEVTIQPKEYLHVAPILEPVTSHGNVGAPARGSGISWIFLGDTTGHAMDDTEPMFRLEIVVP